MMQLYKTKVDQSAVLKKEVTLKTRQGLELVCNSFLARSSLSLAPNHTSELPRDLPFSFTYLIGSLNSMYHTGPEHQVMNVSKYRYPSRHFHAPFIEPPLFLQKKARATRTNQQ
jgi:hypothetical protein